MQNQTVSEIDKPKPKSVWTKEEEALFLKLYNEGVGFSEICRRLGKTRTQIMGKISSFRRRQKTKETQNLSSERSGGSNPLQDLTFKELLEAVLSLYPRHSKACMVLLDKAKEMLSHE
jgi:transposase